MAAANERAVELRLLGGLAVRLHAEEGLHPAFHRAYRDIDVVVATREDVPAAVERLEALGYRHQGDLGIPGREAFDWPPAGPRHHVYVLAAHAEELRRHLRFRDRLRADPAAAHAYEELKRELAECHAGDRVAYGDGKSEFVERILATVPAQT